MNILCFRLMLLACTMLWFVLSMAYGQENVPASSTFTLSPMTNPPTIDGTIGTDEWVGASRIIGFVNGSSLEPRLGETYVGYDMKNLYVAVSTDLPPTKQLATNVLVHDENTVMDDSIELWFDPNPANRLATKGDQRYYQIILNSAGNAYDAVFDPTQGLANTGWDLKGQQCKSHLDLEKMRWEFELAIPWSSFSIAPADLNNRQVGLHLARNWKDPWNQTPFLPVTGFSNWNSYPLFTLAPNAPVVQEASLGDIFAGKLNYDLAITNPSQAPLTLTAKVTVDTSDMPSFAKEDTLTIAAGATEHFLLTDNGRLHQGANHTLNATVTSPDGKQVYFRRTLVVTPPRENVWQIPAMNREKTWGYIAYYPSYNILMIRVDLSEMSGVEKVTAGNVLVLDASGKEIANGNVTLAKQTGETTLAVPNLPNGVYTVRVTLQGEGAPEKPFEKTFTRQHFPWEQNILGISDKVFAPFTPIAVQGNAASVVLRTYRMNGFGLWDSIISKGREILAGPMTIDYTTAAGKAQWSGAKGAFVKSVPAQAVFQAAAQSPVVLVKTTSTLEYDGCMKVELELQPGAVKQTINRLWINIPLKDALAPFWHLCASNTIRSNPTGDVPQGNGVVWESTKSGNGAMLGSFFPYIWLGGPERGVCWFADNDKGWITNDEQPELLLIRENGQLILRVMLINTPAMLEKPHKIVFGLQASPTKPLPANWRAATGIPQHGGSNGYWGIYPGFAGKYPADNDFRYADEQLAERISGMGDAQFLGKWINEKLRAVSSNQEWINGRIAHVNGGLGALRGNKSPAVLYYEEHYQDQTTPEFVVFQDEWGEKNFTKRDWATKPEDSSGASINFDRSYQDFALWYALQWNLHGVGLYCDNTFPHNSYNLLMTEAYQRPDGQIQPSASMWNLREYHKRLWVLEQQSQPLTQFPLMISLHMTNGNILPIMTWGDINLDNEWSWPNGEGPFPTSVLLTEMSGLQVGSYPHALYAIIGDNILSRATGKGTPEVVRAEWAMRFVHEILRQGVGWSLDQNPLEKLVRNFGYGKAAVQIIHYWDGADQVPGSPLISSSNPQIKWLGLWKPKEKELLLVTINWRKIAQQTTLTVSAPKGLQQVKWQDTETKMPVNGKASYNGWEVKVFTISLK